MQTVGCPRQAHHLMSKWLHAIWWQLELPELSESQAGCALACWRCRARSVCDWRQDSKNIPVQFLGVPVQLCSVSCAVRLLPARVNVQPPFGMGDRPNPTNDVLGMRRPFLQHRPSRVPTRRRRRRKSCPRLTGVCFHPQILSPSADFKPALQGRKTGSPGGPPTP